MCAKWKGRLEATSSSSSHELDNQRLETCVEIGLRCTEDDPNERPAIKDIVCQLEELEAKSRNKMSLASSEGQSRDFQVYTVYNRFNGIHVPLYDHCKMECPCGCAN